MSNNADDYRDRFLKVPKLDGFPRIEMKRDEITLDSVFTEYRRIEWSEAIHSPLIVCGQRLVGGYKRFFLDQRDTFNAISLPLELDDYIIKCIHLRDCLRFHDCHLIDLSRASNQFLTRGEDDAHVGLIFEKGPHFGRVMRRLSRLTPHVLRSVESFHLTEEELFAVCSVDNPNAHAAVVQAIGRTKRRLGVGKLKLKRGDVDWAVNYIAKVGLLDTSRDLLLMLQGHLSRNDFMVIVDRAVAKQNGK